MFEQYPMIHYEFAQVGTGIQKTVRQEETAAETVSETLNPAPQSDYRLRGWVDVLPFYPQAEDDFFSHLHLQSFSHMHSLADYYTSRHSVQSCLLVHTADGNGKLECGGTVFHLKRNDIFLIDCRHPHTYMTEGSCWQHTDIHIGGSGAQTLLKEFMTKGSPLVHLRQTVGFQADVYSLLDDYLSLEPHRSLRIALRIETMLTHLILENSSAETEKATASVNLQNLISYMHAHFREPLTLDELSDYCGLSKYHLSRQFKKITGLAPNEYLIRLRLENARTLLINTDYSIRRTGEMSGFENEAYFSRIFHNRFKRSPKQYRSENKTSQL